MPEYRGFDIFDYLILLARWKKLLISIFLISLIISYVTIYFLIPAEYESTAVIIPSDDSNMGMMSGIMKNLKDLPLGLGGASKSAITDMYLTIIYSRSTLEDVVKKFELQKDYNEPSMEKTLKAFTKRVSADLTDENAFVITVRAHSPKKAANIVNYMLTLLNKTIIELNIAKSKDNREFLEQRYAEIKANLKISEDSLQAYQDKSGLLEVKEQSKLILSAITELESQVTTKKIELSVLKKMNDSEAPQVKMLNSQLEEIQKEFNKLKNSGNENILLPYKSLPEKSKNYLRLYRDVEIYNAILEYIVPLYEQAKLEEQKNIPVLQVVDYGRIPEKKAYPSRTLYAIIISIITLSLLIVTLIANEVLKKSENPKLLLLKQQFRSRK